MGCGQNHAKVKKKNRKIKNPYDKITKAWLTLQHKHKHKHKHKRNECSHLLHKHKSRDIRKRNELQNDAVGVWDEVRFQNGPKWQTKTKFSWCFCCSADASYLFTHDFHIKAAFISETCKCSLNNTKGFLFVILESSEPEFVIEARIIANCLGKFRV